MVRFNGINHVALTVTDLDTSERFYCDLLGFTMVLDLGFGRLCLDRYSGFSLALVHPPDASADAFSPLRTGLDHLGLAAGSRDDLEEWQRRLTAAGVECSPIQDMIFGHHLNFKDPDGIALELQAPNQLYSTIITELATTDISDVEVRRRAAQLLGR